MNQKKSKASSRAAGSSGPQRSSSGSGGKRSVVKSSGKPGAPSGPAAAKSSAAQKSSKAKASDKKPSAGAAKNPKKVGHGGFRGRASAVSNEPVKIAKGEQPLQLRFLTSSANMAGCPVDTFPEIAIVGRSNAGKSSLINAMAQSRIAMVSSSPGKTRLLNFFQGPSYRLVDMPGYGYAARGGGEMNDWRKMIETFLATRSNLVGLYLIMDIRREWTEDEQNLLDWLAPRQLPCAIILTKADKISNNEITTRIARMRKTAQRQAVFAVSSTKRAGLKAFEDYGFNEWVKEPAK